MAKSKSKRNVAKQESKVPAPPPLPPPPLRQTKSSPPPPPPLKSEKISAGKEFSSETNSTYHPSEKSSSVAQVEPSNNVETSAKVKGAKSKKGKNLSPQKTIQDSDSSKSDQPPTYISKASWIPQQSQPQDDTSVSGSDASLNKVYFFDEQQCSDPDDEFLFTCCVPPYAPRYPPNPRPRRRWDPSVLPTGTNIPTSIGKPCKRCGQEVFLAELHLSSRGVYHTECYKCCLCGKSLDSWSVAEHKSELFCKGCYRRNFALHGCGFGVGAGQIASPNIAVLRRQLSGRPIPYQKLLNKYQLRPSITKARYFPYSLV